MSKINRKPVVCYAVAAIRDGGSFFAGSPARWRMASADECVFVFWRWLPRISVLLLLHTSFLVPAEAQRRAQNRKDEVLALASFRSGIEVTEQTGSGGGVLEPRGYWSSWRETDQNPCAWVGVTCTPNFTVEALDLSGWGLNRLWGVADLSVLPDLRQLDLSSNNFGDENGDSALPDDVGMLTNIVRLDLSRNSFGSAIPPNITLCRSLRYLSLEQNVFSGEIPDLSGLVDLQVLSLADNLLIGPFPKALGELTSLVSVDLSGNMLNGSIPSLSKLTNLLDLKLDRNNFTKFATPELPIAKNMEHLFVSGNQLEGVIPPGITKMLSLQVLNMSNNRLSGEIPYGLAFQVNHSFWLDLSLNELTGQIPADLLLSTPSYNVASVNLSHNLLTGNIPISLDGGGTRLFYDVLDLSHNRLSGPMPFINKNETTQIYKLWLQNNSLSGDIVNLFTNSFSFEYSHELRFQDNLFTGDLSRMANNWTNLFRLEVLDLSNNNIQMSTAESLSDPLRSTLESFCGTPLRELRLGGNNFSGTSLPAAYVSCTNEALEVLDFSNSHLKGQISGYAFNSTWLPGLKFLNFSNNEVTGNIPESTLTLPNLVVLDVSNNNLSGALPMILPGSSLYDPRFFAGNVLLCGDPLLACPSNRTGVVYIDQRRSGVHWWVLLIIVGGSAIIAVSSCAVATWRWRVYRKRHQQDADLIRTLMERDSATLMSLRELKKATDNFAESAQIGEGGFGTVYTGKLNDGTRVAIKKSKREGTERDKEQFLNEVRILSQVNHRNLVKLLGCCMENKVALLVFEFVSNGTLQEHLQGKMGPVHLDWKQRLNVAVQTADALNYLHSAATFPIYHRDVKSANILLTENLSAKVADFGISKLVPVEATHVSTVAVQGTMGYIDPEYYTSYQLNGKSDVYSFGVVLLELISAKPAIDFQRGGEDTNLANFANPLIQSEDMFRLIDPALVEPYSLPAVRDSILNVGRLAMQCLDMRSKARPSMNEVWIELQSLWLELDGTSKHLDSIDEDYSTHLTRYEKSFNFKSFDVDNTTSTNVNSTSSTMDSDARALQMARFSPR